MVRKELFSPRLRLPGKPGTQKKGHLGSHPKKFEGLFFSRALFTYKRDTGNTCFKRNYLLGEVAWARKKSLIILVVFIHNSDKNLWESPWKILHTKDLPGFWCYFGVWESTKTCPSIKFQPVTAWKTPHIQHEKHLCFFHSPTLQKCWPFPGTPNNHETFQLDDSKPILEKMVFHQTSIKKCLFRVPGPKVFHPFCLFFCLAPNPSYMKPSIHGKMSMPNPSPFQHRKSCFHSSFAA